VIDTPQGEFLLEKPQMVVVEWSGDEFDEPAQVCGGRRRPGLAAVVPEADQRIRHQVAPALELLGCVAVIDHHDDPGRIGTQVVVQQGVLARHVGDRGHQGPQGYAVEARPQGHVIVLDRLSVKIQLHGAMVPASRRRA